MTNSLKSDSTSVAPPAASTPKKGRAKAAVKPKALATKKEEKKVATVASHPTSANMVVEAITKLAEKNGSSLQAIKKSIAVNHKVDIEKHGIHIKKALKKLVETGKLTQTTGKGAAGSFKLTAQPKPAKKDAAVEKKTKKVASSKKAAATAKKPASKKGATSKKTAASTKAKKDGKLTATKKPAAAKETVPAVIAKPADTEKKAAVTKSTKPGKAGTAKAKAAPKIRLPKPTPSLKAT